MFTTFDSFEPMMPPADELAVRSRIAQLKEEHRDLDAAIAALEHSPVVDALSVARMKKRKLSIKDQINALENSLIPDIIA